MMNEQDNELFSIGGSASNSGVEFYSDNYTAKFVMDKTGSYEITHDERLELGRVRDILYRIPIIKGLFAVIDRNPLFVIPIIGLIVLDVIGVSGSVESVDNKILTTTTIIVGVATLISLLYVIKTILFKIKKTWMFHGAEHKTIYTYEKGDDLTLENVRASPRIARRCGTNMVVFCSFFFIIFWFTVDFSSIRIIGSYILAYEIFDLENGDKYPVIKWFFNFGHICQQKLFTSEPTDEQINASIETINKLIELEHSVKYEDIL